jgi:hypothetical protein
VRDAKLGRRYLLEIAVEPLALEKAVDDESAIPTGQLSKLPQPWRQVESETAQVWELSNARIISVMIRFAQPREPAKKRKRQRRS